MSANEQRAAAPAIPAVTREQERQLAALAERHREGEQVERSRQLRGLLVLAFVVLVLSIARAGLASVFPHGWWRIW
jgi:hypothetical protein